MPSVPRSFSGCVHAWYSLAPPLDQTSSFKVNEIFNLDLAKRDSKALLKKRRLQSGIDSWNGIDVVNFFSFFIFFGII